MSGDVQEDRECRVEFAVRWSDGSLVPHAASIVLDGSFARSYGDHSTIAALHGSAASGDRDHAPVSALGCTSARGNCGNSPVSTLRTPVSRRYSHHAPVSTLGAASARWYRDHASVSTLRSAVAHSDRHHVTIAAHYAPSTIGYGHGSAVSAGHFSWHCATPELAEGLPARAARWPTSLLCWLWDRGELQRQATPPSCSLLPCCATFAAPQMWRSLRGVVLTAF